MATRIFILSLETLLTICLLVTSPQSVYHPLKTTTLWPNYSRSIEVRIFPHLERSSSQLSHQSRTKRRWRCDNSQWHNEISGGSEYRIGECRDHGCAWDYTSTSPGRDVEGCFRGCVEENWVNMSQSFCSSWLLSWLSEKCRHHREAAVICCGPS